MAASVSSGDAVEIKEEYKKDKEATVVSAKVNSAAVGSVAEIKEETVEDAISEDDAGRDEMDVEGAFEETNEMVDSVKCVKIVI